MITNNTRGRRVGILMAVVAACRVVFIFGGKQAYRAGPSACIGNRKEADMRELGMRAGVRIAHKGGALTGEGNIGSIIVLG